MHDNGELEGIDRAQLENEIQMPDEIAAIEKEQRQIEKFYQTAEEDCGLSHEETQGWFDIVIEDAILDGGAGEIRDLLFDDIDSNGVTDMVIIVQETEMKYMYGTGAIYFYMNGEEPYCFTDEAVPFFYWDICYADLEESMEEAQVPFESFGEMDYALFLETEIEYGDSGEGTYYRYGIYGDFVDTVRGGEEVYFELCKAMLDTEISYRTNEDRFGTEVCL